MQSSKLTIIVGAIGAAVFTGMALAQGSKSNEKMSKSLHPAASQKVRGHSGVPTPTRKGVIVPLPATKSEIPKEVWEQINARLAPGQQLEEEARTLLKSGNLVAAEQACLKAMEIYKGDPQTEVARQLLGDIYFAQEKYQKALEVYHVADRYTDSTTLHFNAALCYLRLGNYEAARRFYSDQSLLQYSSIKPEDLPGTDTPHSLEASILMARGLDAFFSDRNQEALNNLDAAGKLAPRNGLIPYYAGMSLLHMNRTLEAGPYFQKAAQYGHGKMAEDAAWRLGNVAAWRKTHP